FDSSPNARNRWGDYSATVVDPVNDTDFWTLQEFAAIPVGLGANRDRWGTWWANVVPPALVLEVLSATPASANRGSTLTVAITGHLFQNGAHVAFNLGGVSDKKIKLLSTTFVSASEIDVTIKLKKKAAVGPRDLVLTNPDNTSATATAAFNVN